jgi:hypothetical protein
VNEEWATKGRCEHTERTAADFLSKAILSSNSEIHWLNWVVCGGRQVSDLLMGGERERDVVAVMVVVRGKERRGESKRGGRLRWLTGRQEASWDAQPGCDRESGK